MVVDPAGPPCPCGRRGCWERFASGAGLGMLAREAALAGRLDEVVHLAGGDPESVRGEDVSAAAAAGDPAAQQVIEEVGWWVGFGLANLACVIDPECFVLGGGLVAGGRPPPRVGPRRPSPDWSRAADAVRPWPDRPGRLRRTGRRRRRRARRHDRVGCGDPDRRGAARPSVTARRGLRAAAEAAVAAGVDGVFCYDHLWPMGQPERPALAPFPLLGALATRFAPSRGDGARPVLRARWSPASVSCPTTCWPPSSGARPGWPPAGSSPGLGTGDRLSADENRAYGIPFHPAADAGPRWSRAGPSAVEPTGSPSGWPEGRLGASTRRGRPAPRSTCGTPIPRW